jgi:hypothetical protein
MTKHGPTVKSGQGYVGNVGQLYLFEEGKDMRVFLVAAYTLGNLGVRILNGRRTEMARIWMIGMVCALAASPALAGTLFTDGFESGVSGTTWVNSGTGTLLLSDTAKYHAGSKSAKQPASTTIYGMKTATAFPDATIIPAGQLEVASVWMYDEATTGINQSLFYLTNNALTDYFLIGVNTQYYDPTHYIVRSAHNQYQPTSIVRTPGWHELKITVAPYTGADAWDVNYYVDGNFAAVLSRQTGTGAVVLDQVRLGVSLATSVSNFWFDDVGVLITPEPASLLLLAGAGVTLLRRRRRG